MSSVLYCAKRLGMSPEVLVKGEVDQPDNRNLLAPVNKPLATCE